MRAPRWPVAGCYTRTRRRSRLPRTARPRARTAARWRGYGGGGGARRPDQGRAGRADRRVSRRRAWLQPSLLRRAGRTHPAVRAPHAARLGRLHGADPGAVDASAAASSRRDRTCWSGCARRSARRPPDRPLGGAEFARLQQVARLAMPYAYSLSGHVLYTDARAFPAAPEPGGPPRARRPARHRPAAPLRRRDLRGLVGARRDRELVGDQAEVGRRLGDRGGDRGAVTGARGSPKRSSRRRRRTSWSRAGWRSTSTTARTWPRRRSAGRSATSSTPKSSSASIDTTCSSASGMLASIS